MSIIEYQDNDLERERGFILFYSYMNVGAVLSPIVYGVIINFAGWSWCFIVSAILLSLMLIPFLLNEQIKTLDKPSHQYLMSYLATTAAIVIVFVGFVFSNIANIMIVILFIASLQATKYSLRHIVCLHPVHPWK